MLQGVTISLYDMDGQTVQSSNEEKMNIPLPPSQLKKVTQGESVSYQNDDIL